MLFAAGFGRRMRPLTDTRPKPLVPVAGRPLLDHAMDLTKPLDLRRIVGNVHYMAQTMATALTARGVTALPERPDILETGGGLKQALPILGPDPVFTLNTDAVWTGAAPLARLRAAWDPARMGALLLLVRPGDALGHSGPGDFAIGPDGRLRRAPGSIHAAIYTGAQILRTETVAAMPDHVFSLNRVWDRLIAEGRLYGLLHDGRWCDVGRPESVALAETMLRGTDRV